MTSAPWAEASRAASSCLSIIASWLPAQSVCSSAAFTVVDMAPPRASRPGRERLRPVPLPGMVARPREGRKPGGGQGARAHVSTQGADRGCARCDNRGMRLYLIGEVDDAPLHVALETAVDLADGLAKIDGYRFVTRPELEALPHGREALAIWEAGDDAIFESRTRAFSDDA